tara:strand:+ start:3212 stop:3448 length:237 start_codon:yes stop_codon:yes gene_type:complete
MKINIFEAARRVSRLVGAIWIIGWIVIALNNDMQGDPIYFAIMTFGGLFLILVATSVIGYVVRKFMGITGKNDKKTIN